ncbi:MAG: SIS domain-containing protein [Planctomycetota bacterium]|nr:phosphoheptose isomerase [Planctomycetota bacterium]MDP6519320.1 SIS domain-containing protein [Planctomycetota bacterium]MDP6837751.1 SIS domain-containing protein [Planctomycetota bacterium]MDP6955730.1 SIS domain-containing protein [Planctomycetota bacterium]
MTHRDHIRASLAEAARTLDALLADERALAAVDDFVSAACRTLRAGGRLLTCGNGGSMCDAMHFAEEWTGRFRADRPALAALCFSDPSHLTCIANDFGFEEVFARQVQAQGRAGDLLVAISTSGNSENILRACAAARALDITVVGLLGNGGGKQSDVVDIPIVVPGQLSSDRVQEIHIKILHTVIEAAERELFPELYG